MHAVLLCLVCLFNLACFFLPSHLSLKHVSKLHLHGIVYYAIFPHNVGLSMHSPQLEYFHLSTYTSANLPLLAVLASGTYSKVCVMHHVYTVHILILYHLIFPL